MQLSQRLRRIIADDMLDLVPPEPRPRRTPAGWLLAISAVTATVFAVTWSGIQVFYVATDAWVAPVRMAPSSDEAAQLQSQHQHRVTELARLDAEVARIDGVLETIDLDMATISDVPTTAPAAFEYLQTEAHRQHALRTSALAAAAAQRILLAELEARPIYRATNGEAEIAFVPDDQMAGVRAGAEIVNCTWGVFRCHEVGRVAEILPGQITTQDPWGNVARGQYVVMVLDHKEAIEQRVLRVRS